MKLAPAVKGFALISGQYQAIEGQLPGERRSNERNKCCDLEIRVKRAMQKEYYISKRGLQASMAILCLAALNMVGQQTNQPAVKVWAWGRNDGGQTNVPPSLTNAIGIAGGSSHSLALRTDGTVLAWGANFSGQCDVPASLTNAVALAAGSDHSMALRGDGTLVIWGGRFFSQYGITNVPPGLSNVVAISTQTTFNLALRSDGTVVFWGYNSSNQGNPPLDLTNVVRIAAGQRHSLAVRRDGTVAAWGANDYGQCNVPSGLSNVIAVAAFDHSIALKDDGRVVAWGYNAYGQCNVPADLTNAVAIATGYTYSLALRANGTVVAWGTNGYGASSVPPNLPLAVAVAAGWNHSMALVDPTAAAAAPTILVAPRSQIVEIGGSIVLVVQAVGFPPLSYQWYFGTNLIVGATNASLALTNLQPAQSSEYRVVVTNPAGSATSPPAVLSVLPGLEVQMVPAIALDGGVGLTYRLEWINAVGPTNAWEALATIFITNQPQYYFDLRATGQPKRFYRLLQVP